MLPPDRAWDGAPGRRVGARWQHPLGVGAGRARAPPIRPPRSSSSTTRHVRSPRRALRARDRRGARRRRRRRAGGARRRHAEARRRRIASSRRSTAPGSSRCRRRRRSAPTASAPRTPSKPTRPTTPRSSRPQAAPSSSCAGDAATSRSRRRPTSRSSTALLTSIDTRRGDDMRVGLGFDVHPFGGDGPLVLGGVTIRARPGSPGTPTPTWSRTRSPTRCSARRRCPISARCSRRPTTSCRGASSMGLLGDVRGQGARGRVGRGERRRRRSRPKRRRSRPHVAAMRARTRARRRPSARPGVGEAEASRGARRDRARRGHRRVGRRAPRARPSERGIVRRLASASLTRCVRVYDTLQRAKVDLVLRDPGRVSMYVCGPTVYDVPHVGHGRTAVVFDVIRRYLEWRGFEVTLREQRHRHRGQDHRPCRRTRHDRARGRRGSSRRRTSSRWTGSASAGPTRCRTPPSTSTRCST